MRFWSREAGFGAAAEARRGAGSVQFGRVSTLDHPHDNPHAPAFGGFPGWAAVNADLEKNGERRFVSRGGLKLDAALEAFGLDVAGAVCADLGCSTGGFVDCLLQRGAAQVFAVDTAYGELAWTLRNDDRVTVLERTNALHADPPEEAAGHCALVTVDLGWTKQAKALPAAAKWCGPDGQVVTLVKPHYESGRHRLDDEDAAAIARDTLAAVADAGWTVHGCEPAAVRGGKGKNLEFVAWLTPPQQGGASA